MFRLDDLMVPVFPARAAVMGDCQDDTKCEENTVKDDTGNTVCPDSATSGCITPDDAPPAEAWRSEQFARLAKELEGALAG